jgi:DNA polymerase bacteriophage-type
MTKLYLDVETYSEVPLKHGIYKYAEHCEVMLLTYAIDDYPVRAWDLTADRRLPGDLEYVLYDIPADEVIAHHAMFDRTVLRLSKNLKIVIPIEKWRCTMVKALAHSLPGGLDKLCEVLAILQAQRKLKTGKSLIQLFCKPRPKNSKLRRATRDTHPQEWAQFIEYAQQDTEAMRAIDKKLPTWNYQGRELELWHLDQHINDRGVAVDVDLAQSAIRAIARAQGQLVANTNTLSHGAVTSATQRDKLLAHILSEYQIALPNMQADTLERRIEDPDLPEELRELLKIRLQASMTSGSKYKRLIDGANSDGRLRGLLQFDGASRTGRWAGRVFQPQNLPRLIREAVAAWYGITVEELEAQEKLKKGLINHYLTFGIEAIKADGEDLMYNNVMQLTSNVVRGAIVAASGKKLVVSDLTNIEGRKCAWLAGEEWKLRAFRAYDEGIGPDLYTLAYARAFAISSENVTTDQRQIGKVMELMLQYGGGVGAFITGAATYSIDLDVMAEAALPIIPLDVLSEATGFFEWTVKKKRTTFGLKPNVFIACDALKRLWRRAHPMIVQLWSEVALCACDAINNPNVNFVYRALKFQRVGNWLRIRLSPDHCLSYPAPQIDPNGVISYMGINQYSRKWSRIKTYGGKLVENITQESSRNVLAANMPGIEARGYEIVLTTHDEVVTEAPDEINFCASDLSHLLAHPITWAPGLPLAAHGYETQRYRKE